MRLSLFLGPVLTLLLPTLTAAITVNDVLGKSVAAYAQSKVRRDLVDEVIDDIANLADCSACQALLVVLQALAHLGNDAFTSVIVEVCEALKIEDDDVCAGAIGLEGPILAHDLRSMAIPSKTSELFCLTIFGLCQWPDVSDLIVK